jgi:pimeloyl-ACP methyl ester carboxylesterase
VEPTRYRPISVPLPDQSGSVLLGGEWPGDGVPVLGVPGLGSNHRVWELLAQAAPDLHLFSVDARGRASGFGIPSPHGITTHADDLVAVLDAVGIERVVLAGHSMGGFVGLRFAQRHPDRLQGLVLIDGGPPAKLPGILRSARAVRWTFNRSLPKSRPYKDLGEYWARATKRAATYEQFDGEFVEWAFGIDLAGPPGALVPQQDRATLLDDAVECFTAPWRAEALASITVPCRLLLAEWGAKHGKRPLYRQAPAPQELSPTISVERLGDTDHVEAVWHPATIAAVSSFVRA